MRHSRRWIGVAGFWGVLIMAPQTFGQTTHTVNLTGYSFVPADVTVTVEDTVEWIWLDGVHNVESGVGGIHDGSFRSGDPVSGATYSVVFDQSFLDANPLPGDTYITAHRTGALAWSARLRFPRPSDGVPVGAIRGDAADPAAGTIVVVHRRPTWVAVRAD